MSSSEPSNRSAQRCAPLVASINCAVMRTRFPPFRTEPSRTPGGADIADPENTYWSDNVLDLLLAQIVKHKGQPVADLVMNRIGDEHSAGVSQGFDPRGDVDAAQTERVTFHDHNAEVDPTRS